jgi:hypothetical protein
MCKQGFSEILKHPPVVRAARIALVATVLILAMCEQDPLDKLLGDDDDDEFAARRPAPTVVNVGPQPRASRRRQRPVAQPDPEEEELWEEVQQSDEVLTRTGRRGRSQRQASRELREAVQDLRQAAQDHGVDEDEALAMALGVDEDEALAMAIAASLADAPAGSVCHDQLAAAAEAAETEPTVAANPGARAGRAARRRQSTEADGTGTQSRGNAHRAASRKRVVHVDPISGQRIRAPRFPRRSIAASSVRPPEAAQKQEPAEDDETAGESDEEQPTAEAVAAENERRAREQVLEERLGRTLAAPVAAPSPLKPSGNRRPVSIGSPASPDLMCSSPPDQASDDTSNASSSSDLDFPSDSPTSTSALDTSAGGEQDLMSRLQKRMRSGKASTTARQSATPLQEREQNRQDSLQLADDM